MSPDRANGPEARPCHDVLREVSRRYALADREPPY